jgi:hypothetical protein
VNSVTLSCTLQAISATELLSLLFPWFVLVVFALTCHSRRSIHGYKVMLEIEQNGSGDAKVIKAESEDSHSLNVIS